MSYVKELSKIVSDFHIPSAEDSPDGAASFEFAPEVILYPKTVSEISEVFRLAFRNGLRIFPFSGGTKLFLGNSVGKVEAALSLRHLDRILSHEIPDMVSTVECGTKLVEFQSAVERENQLFPVDPPCRSLGATVGGFVSSNFCGPMSTGYGTCRELILGAKAVRADGEIINVGGKVVKNVAGYDIAKLLVGSLGTLCVIVEATFRLYPRQPFSKSLVLGFKDYASCSEAVRAILDTDVVPTCFEVLDEKLSSEFGAAQGMKRSILLRFDNFEEAVIWQTARVKEIVSATASEFFELEHPRASSIWELVREFPFSSKGSFFSKLVLPITGSIEMLENIESGSPLAGVELRCLSRPARGIILVSVNGEPDSALESARFLENLARSLKGGIMFSGICPELREEIKAWGDFGNSLGLMKNVKRRFDPKDVLLGEKIFNAQAGE